MTKRGEAVVVLGASPKPERYAFRAFQMLREYGYRPIPVNPAYQTISGEPCYKGVRDVPEKIDTISLYLGQARSKKLIPEIVSARPRRIIMNPGAENTALAQAASEQGIAVVKGCTLVMLRSGEF